jgi:hypothetical protein
MGSWSDYPDEMDRLTPEQIEAILEARDVDDPSVGRLSSLMRDLREELLTEIPGEVAERHLAAMAAETEEEPATTRRNAMAPFNRKRTVLLSLAAVLILGMGVATAVTLPDQASDRAKDVVGALPIPGPTGSVPPTDPAGEANDHGEAVSDVAQDDSVEGCEKGMAVSEVASSKAGDNQPDGPEPCGTGEDGGEGASAQGSGGGSGSGGSGGGSGGGGSTAGGGSGSGSGDSSGGGGSGGGGSTVGGGSGSGSGGPGGDSGSGGGGSTVGGGSGSSDGPDGLPTPDDLPTGGG